MHRVDRTQHTRQRARPPVGRGPKTIAISPDGALAASADERSDTVTLIDLASHTTTTIALGADGPCGLAFAPGGERLYETARRSNELLVLAR